MPFTGPVIVAPGVCPTPSTPQLGTVPVHEDRPGIKKMVPVKNENVTVVPSLSLKTHATLPALSEMEKKLLPGGAIAVAGDGPFPGYTSEKSHVPPGPKPVNDPDKVQVVVVPSKEQSFHVSRDVPLPLASSPMPVKVMVCGLCPRVTMPALAPWLAAKSRQKSAVMLARLK